MKRYRLRPWVKVVLCLLVVVGFMYMAGSILGRNADELERAVDNCQAQGNSYNYCMKGVYGG